MVNRKIQMKKFNGSGWDNLYPHTLTQNVFDTNGIDLETNLSNVINNFNTSINNVNNRLDDEIDLRKNIISKIKENYMLSFDDYNPKKDGVADDGVKLQQALDDIHSMGGGILRIKNGYYLLKQQIVVYENTTLLMDKETYLQRGHSNTMFTNGVPTDSFTGYNGRGNISFIGGVIDGNYSKNHLYPATALNHILFAHAKNIMFKSVEFLDVYSYHALDMNGIDGLIIEDCKFRGYRNFTSQTTPREMIQIAECELIEFGLSDFTPCRNVYVLRNEFSSSSVLDSFKVGVGNHYSRQGVQQTHIVIKDNVFYGDGTSEIAIRPYKWKNVLIQNNVVYDVENGVRLSNVTGNTLSSTTPSGVQTNLAESSEDIYIQSNEFNNCRDNAIVGYGLEYNGQLSKMKNIIVEDNVIENCNGSALLLENINGCVIMKNVFKDVYRGIWLRNPHFCDISKNYFEEVSREGIYINEINVVSDEKGLLNKINENKFISCAYNSIFTNDLKYSDINNNIIYNGNTSNGSRGGIYVKLSDNVSILGNTIVGGNNTFGVNADNTTCTNIQTFDNKGDFRILNFGTGALHGYYTVDSNSNIVGVSVRL